MNKWSNRLDTAFRWTVVGIMGIILLYLSALSIHSTSYVYGEARHNITDYPMKHLIVYCIIVVLLVVVKHYIMPQMTIVSFDRGKLLALMLSIIGFFTLYILLSIQPIPIEDQLRICTAGAGLHNFDFSIFAPGNYMDVYSKQQPGIALFLWGFFAVFGDNNYLAFQIMNVFCIMLDIYFIAKIYNAFLEGWNSDKNAKNLADDVEIYIVVTCFLPFFLYVTYVYGTILGFTLSLGATVALMKYLSSRKKRYIIWFSLFSGLAVWIKVNYLIFVIAIVIYLLIDFWKTKNYISIIGMLGIALAISGIGQFSDSIIEKRTGMELSEGAPMVCWITMAFSQDENGNPVGYNAYPRETYYGNDRDIDRVSAVAYEDLKERLGELTQDMGTFCRFMGKKIAIQWNEPSFESIHINTRHIVYQADSPKLISEILDNYEMNWFTRYVNLFHSAVLLGALTWVLLCGRDVNLERLFGATVFIGGFLFSLFWESGSRYMLIYFLLLIPYAVSGYEEMAKKIETIFFTKETKENVRKKLIKTGIVTGGVVCILLLARMSESLFWIHSDDEEYTTLLLQHEEEQKALLPTLPDGRYVVSPLEMPGYGIHSCEEQDEEGVIFVELSQINEINSGILTLHHDYQYDLLRINSTQLLLSLTKAPQEEGVKVAQDCDEVLWKVIETEDGNYAIVYNEFCLAVVDGRLCLEPYTGKENQVWTFTKV